MNEQEKKLSQEAARRVKNLIEYIQDSTILEDSGKQDLIGWLNWASAAPDSTVVMQWFHNFHMVFGYYLSMLQELIDRKKIAVNKVMAMSRRGLEKRTAGKVTDAMAKTEAYLNPLYETVATELTSLERLYNFISFTKEGLDSDLVQSFGHNQRLEMRQDDAA